MTHRSTILSQLLKVVPRHEFEALAKRHRKRCQLHSMTRWAQLAALALGQLPNWCGLRDGAHDGRPLKLGAAVLEADLRDRPDSFGLVGRFQRHDSRCRMWVPPEDKDPVLRHTPPPASRSPASARWPYAPASSPTPSLWCSMPPSPRSSLAQCSVTAPRDARPPSSSTTPATTTPRC